MKFLLEKQPKSRKENILKLKSFMNNPGRFSILLLGERGTGKSFWINQINKDTQSIKYLNASLIEETIEYWKKQLSKADKGILVITDFHDYN